MENTKMFRDDFVGLQNTLGIRTLEASQDRVVMELDVGSNVHQYTRVLHGGVSAVLAESAACLGARLSDPEQRLYATADEINVSHLRPKSAGKVQAVAELLLRERDSEVWEVNIRDEDGKAIAVARCRVSIVPLDQLPS